MTQTKIILSELQSLIQKNSIDISSFFSVEQEFTYDPIKHYIKAISEFQTKPETASHELFRSIIKDTLKIEAFNEVKIGNGFVDFAIKENIGNPLLIELKPLFKFIKSKGVLKAEELDFTDHKNQVLKYLRTNEYVILTNLKEAFLFSRNAIIDFEPFASLGFVELLHSFIRYQNLWDTLRRIEDQNIKVDLDKSFFEDLKNWYNEFKSIRFIENDKFTNEELIVLLLNKIIFIKTLDDFGLIQFNQIVDEYLNKKEKWGAKGSEKILTRFFAELEEYFDDFYDTELFKEKFWNYVVKDKSNTDKFMYTFERALGLDNWSRSFGRGMLHYQYRWIDEDIFGKAYETFIAENKKDSGIFYTPKDITQYMAKKLVDQLFMPVVSEIVTALDKDDTNLETADQLIEELYNIRIIDTAAGSGSFLIKILREIYNCYQMIENQTSWVGKLAGTDLFDQPKNYQDAKAFRQKHFFNSTSASQLQLISKIVLKHIYAADIDERALETAKTNIWKEAIKLNPRIYNYKNLNGENNHILPNLELNFICGDTIADLPIDLQLKIISEEFSSEIKRLHEIRNGYLINPFYPDFIDEALEIKRKIFERLKIELPLIENPVFVCVDFFFCYFDGEGKILEEEKRGFHGAIGNPPWEAIKPVEKEFAGKGKGEIDILNFKKWFEEKLATDDKFRGEWQKYTEFYENYKSHISSRYNYQGVGDPNYYKLFLEKDLELLRSGGVVNILVPSGIQTDKGCSELRDLLINKNQLHELLSFENRGYTRIVNGEEKTIRLFPEVDSRFKFTIVNASKQPTHPFNTFDAKFYMHDPDELYNRTPINYNIEMVRKFSPENLSIMEFRTEQDYELCKKIRAEHTLFGELEYRLYTEFHMTNDSNLFHRKEEIEKKKDQNKILPLYEGKMIHQFNSAFDEPRYFVYEKEAKQQLLETELRSIKRQYDLDEKEISKLKIDLEYQNYRLAYRSIGSSTNERSLISSLIPPKSFIGHSMNYLRNYNYEFSKGKLKQTQTSFKDVIVLMSLLNSLTLNYYIRNKISANLTMNFIYELPFPELNNEQKDYLTTAGLNLLANFNEKKIFNKLFTECGFAPKAKINSIKVRAELELFIAKEIYGLTDEEWAHLTSTFSFGGDTKTRKELTEIIELSLKK